MRIAADKSSNIMTLDPTTASRHQITLSDLPLSAALKSEQGKPHLLDIKVTAPWGNLLVDLRAEVPEANAESLAALLNSIGMSADSMSSDAANLHALLEGLEGCGGTFTKVLSQCSAATAPKNGGTPAVKVSDEIARVQRFVKSFGSVAAVNTTVLQFGEDVKRESSNLSMLDEGARASSGVIWVDIDLGGTGESDQAAYHLEDPDQIESLGQKESVGIESLVQTVLPSAFTKDGHAARRGTPDYVAMDARVLSLKLGEGGEFTGSVYSPKLFMFVGEGVLVTLHTGPMKVVQTVQDDLTRDGWSNDQKNAGAGSVAIRVLEKLLARNERVIRQFEVEFHKVDVAFRDSESPLGQGTKGMFGRMGPTLRYMKTQQEALISGVSALIQASLRDNLSDMFCLEQTGRALARANAAVAKASNDLNRISSVLGNISDLQEQNQTRILELARQEQELARKTAEAAKVEAARSAAKRERFWSMITAATGLVFPYGLGLATAQVFPEARMTYTVAGGLASALLVGWATVSGAINWGKIFSLDKSE